MRLSSSSILQVLRRGKQPNIARQPKKLMGHYSQRNGYFMFEKEKVPIFASPDLSDFKERSFKINLLLEIFNHVYHHPHYFDYV